VSASAAERRVVVPALTHVAPADPRAVFHRLAGETMGTTWAVTVVGSPDVGRAELRAAIERELDTVVAQMSTWREDSDLSRFNRAPAGTDHPVPAGLWIVLNCALSVARDSGGAYDPTVGPLVSLWGFGPPLRHTDQPSAEAIDAVRARIGWDRVAIDAARRQIRQPGGIAIDLSAVAKGYAVDEVAASLRRLGIDSFLVDIGGEQTGAGTKPDGQPWWVAIERPPGADHVETVVALHGLSIATSGDYRWYFEHRGRRYAHTIDPRTGYPATGGLASVTVLHRDCMTADALSTAMTVMGAAAAMTFATSRRIAALLVERTPAGFVEHVTPGLAEMSE